MFYRLEFIIMARLHGGRHSGPDHFERLIERAFDQQVALLRMALPFKTNDRSFSSYKGAP